MFLSCYKRFLVKMKGFWCSTHQFDDLYVSKLFFTKLKLLYFWVRWIELQQGNFAILKLSNSFNCWPSNDYDYYSWEGKNEFWKSLELFFGKVAPKGISSPAHQVLKCQLQRLSAVGLCQKLTIQLSQLNKKVASAPTWISVKIFEFTL